MLLMPLELLLPLEWDLLLPLELVITAGCCSFYWLCWFHLEKLDRAYTLVCFLPLLVLFTLQVLSGCPIRGTNKYPATTKSFLHGACIEKKNEQLHTT